MLIQVLEVHEIVTLSTTPCVAVWSRFFWPLYDVALLPPLAVENLISDLYRLNRAAIDSSYYFWIAPRIKSALSQLLSHHTFPERINSIPLQSLRYSHIMQIIFFCICSVTYTSFWLAKRYTLPLFTNNDYRCRWWTLVRLQPRISTNQSQTILLSLLQYFCNL